MLVAIYRKILRRNKQGKAPRCDALLGALVRVTRLERAISASQMRRGTNSATPGYSLFCHDTTASGKNKVFSVCGHSCGQSHFYAVFGNQGKSRKRRCHKALRCFALPRPGYRHGTPKAGALPTALHPVIEFFIRLVVFSQTRRDTNFAIPGCLRAALLRRPFIVPYFPPGRKMEPKLFSIHAPGPASQAVSPASRRQTLTPAMARAKTNQKMLITRG